MSGRLHRRRSAPPGPLTLRIGRVIVDAGAQSSRRLDPRDLEAAITAHIAGRADMSASAGSLATPIAEAVAIAVGDRLAAIAPNTRGNGR